MLLSQKQYMYKSYIKKNKVYFTRMFVYLKAAFVTSPAKLPSELKGRANQKIPR